MDSARILARGLKRLRADREMSQADLAEAADLSVQFVSALEQEGRSATLQSISKLSQGLGVTISQLFAAGEPKKRVRSSEAQLTSLMEGFSARQQRHVVNVVTEIAALIRRG